VSNLDENNRPAGGNRRQRRTREQQRSEGSGETQVTIPPELPSDALTMDVFRPGEAIFETCIVFAGTFNVVEVLLTNRVALWAIRLRPHQGPAQLLRYRYGHLVNGAAVNSTMTLTPAPASHPNNNSITHFMRGSDAIVRHDFDEGFLLSAPMVAPPKRLPNGRIPKTLENPGS